MSALQHLALSDGVGQILAEHLHGLIGVVQESLMIVLTEAALIVDLDEVSRLLHGCLLLSLVMKLVQTLACGFEQSVVELAHVFAALVMTDQGDLAMFYAVTYVGLHQKAP